MSDLTEHFKTCDCHDSWDQCPCAEGGHPLDRDCGCCPLGAGICGPLPTVAQRRTALLAKFEALAEDMERQGNRETGRGSYAAGVACRRMAGQLRAVIKEARA